tara:strand:+ start:2905 stop:4275 length:1371 start_codon:yes stop_codon:yes gene_type:complete
MQVTYDTLDTLPTMKTITITVLPSFSDAWLETDATPEERTRLLTFACSLPRTFGTNEELVRTAVTQALASSSEIRTSKCQSRITEFEVENAKLRTSVANAGRDELDRLREEHRVETDRLRDLYHTLSERKVQSESALSARVDEHTSEVIRLTRENGSLHKTIDELKTPAGRGRAGEFVLSEMLYDAGFEVEDTSMGTKKDEGYMDLLVHPKGFPNVRIAIESKNREKIDPKVHIGHFEELTREGITKGLFDSAIFISLRATTKKEGGVHHIHMLEDANGHGTIPVSYLGTERGRDASSLTRDVVQAHVCMHATIMMRFSDLRRTLTATATSDEESDARRQFYDTMHDDLCGMLDDLNIQSKAVNTMQTSMRSSRVRIINLFVRLCDTQRSGGTDTREPCWMPEFRLTRDKVSSGTTDAMVWKNLSDPQKKRVADHLGGRETFLKAARMGVLPEELE